MNHKAIIQEMQQGTSITERYNFVSGIRRGESVSDIISTGKLTAGANFHADEKSAFMMLDTFHIQVNNFPNSREDKDELCRALTEKFGGVKDTYFIGRRDNQGGQYI